MIWPYTLAWIPMIAIGIMNGLLREITYAKYLKELQAHQLSTVIGAILLGVYIGILTHVWILTSLVHCRGDLDDLDGWV